MAKITIGDGVDQVLHAYTQSIVIGLTGRTGSGCSTAAHLLSRPYGSLTFDAGPLINPEGRKLRSIGEYARKHWKPFSIVSASSVITSFVLDATNEDLSASLYSVLKRKSGSDLLAEEIIAITAKARLRWVAAKAALNNPSAVNVDELQEVVAFFNNELVQLTNELKSKLGVDAHSVLQAFGDNLRASGHACRRIVDPGSFLNFPKRMVSIVELLKCYQSKRDQEARIVIDALRNPFELIYLKRVIPDFLCFAIGTQDEDRKSRLIDRLEYSPTRISTLDQKEYPSKNKPLSGYSAFVSQNIQACIERADVYVTNPGKADKESRPDEGFLTTQLVKYVTLMLRPGLITPSREERCMQVAFTARANSGCISRQVGAVVTDANYSICSIGWNDVPVGQIPCLLRNVDDLIAGKDREAFSDYELRDQRFLGQIKSSSENISKVKAVGMPCPFCFKDEYNGLGTPPKDNQVHTRSLHAEENAFLQIGKRGGPKVEKGVLFTTASPCELCSKKAFQMGVEKVIYVDPYPGISNQHVLSSGNKANRPKMELFSGAVGRAYHRLYDPLLPIKDELKARMSKDMVEFAPTQDDTSEPTLFDH